MNYEKPDFYSKNFITICQTHKVKELFAFGSVITDRFNKESDVDLLVNIDEGDPLITGELMLSFWDEMEKYCDRKVDLLTTNSLRNPYLKEEIEKTKKLIYDRSKEKILL